MARLTDADLPPGLVASGDGATAEDVHSDLDAAHARTQERLWWAAGTLYRRRWWVIGLTAIVAAAAVAITLRMPNQYRAETRVLLPESGGGGMLAGALSNLSPAAAALIGGGGGGFTRYMAILTSPSTLETVVDRFDLVSVYDVADEAFPKQAALAELGERAAFDVSLDFDYLAVSVLDEDPARAAQIANFFVERLNERNVAFQSSSAAEYRAFLEERLDRANADLDSTLAALQAIQERTGVVEPGAQAEALFSSLGVAQAAASTAEVEYQALLAQFGPENPDVRSAQAAAEAARAQVGRLTGGGQAGIPAISRLPGVAREYAEVRQSVEIQRAIIETVQPLYEQAALQERRETDAVQVLDPATPPVKKAEPRRSVLVIAATLTGALVIVAMVLLLAVVRERGPALLERLRAAG